MARLQSSPFAMLSFAASLAARLVRHPGVPDDKGVLMPAKSKPADPAALVSEDAIRQRAYYLWEADGRPDGRHEHYWSLAHAEATKALVETVSDGVAKASKAKTANAASPASKSKVKEAAPKAKGKAKPAADAKPAKKATKPRAAIPKVT